MLKRKELLKKASRKFIKGDDDEKEFTWIMVHTYSVYRNDRRFSFKNITNQKEWDEAKRKAGFSSTPFEKPYIINLGCDTKEENERVRKLLNELIL